MTTTTRRLPRGHTRTKVTLHRLRRPRSRRQQPSFRRLLLVTRAPIWWLHVVAPPAHLAPLRPAPRLGAAVGVPEERHDAWAEG